MLTTSRERGSKTNQTTTKPNAQKGARVTAPSSGLSVAAMFASQQVGADLNWVAHGPSENKAIVLFNIGTYVNSVVEIVMFKP